MPNVYLQSAPYQPFTYEELAKPLERLQALHDKVEETYTAMGDNAEQIKSQIGDDNPYALSIYNNYEKTFMDAYNSFAQNGVQDPNTRTQLLNARKAYMNDMGRLSSAITQRQNDLKTRKDAYIKNPNLEMSPVSNLDSYLQGTQTPYIAIDKGEVAKRVEKMSNALSKAMHGFTEEQKGAFIHMYETIGIQGGPAAMLNAIQGQRKPELDKDGNFKRDENGNIIFTDELMFPEFAQLMQLEGERLANEGLGYMNPMQQRAILGAIKEGMLSGMVSDVKQTVREDPLYVARYKAKLAKDNQDAFMKGIQNMLAPQFHTYTWTSVDKNETEEHKQTMSFIHRQDYDAKTGTINYKLTDYSGEYDTEPALPRMRIFNDDGTLMDPHTAAYRYQKDIEALYKKRGYKNKPNFSALGATYKSVEKFYQNNVLPAFRSYGFTDDKGNVLKGITKAEFDQAHLAYYRGSKNGGYADYKLVKKANLDSEESWKFINGSIAPNVEVYDRKGNSEKTIDKSKLTKIASFTKDGRMILSSDKIKSDIFKNPKGEDGTYRRAGIYQPDGLKKENGSAARGMIINIGNEFYYLDDSALPVEMRMQLESIDNDYNNAVANRNKYYNVSSKSGKEIYDEALNTINATPGLIDDVYWGAITNVERPKVSAAQSAQLQSLGSLWYNNLIGE